MSNDCKKIVKKLHENAENSVKIDLYQVKTLENRQDSSKKSSIAQDNLTEIRKKYRKLIKHGEKSQKSK